MRVLGKKEENLQYKYKLNKGLNRIEFLFTKNINDFGFLFCDCKSLSDISALKDWNVSNVTNFSNMFCG